MSVIFSIEIVSFNTCIRCGIPIAGEQSYKTARERDHKSFYCLNGHEQYFSQKSDVERERQRRELAERERDNARREVTREENSHRSTRGHLTRVKKRVAAGVCPCCKRSFPGDKMKRHIKSKHPDFVTEGS